MQGEGAAAEPGKLAAFDNECYTLGQPEPICILYNRASWSWGALALYALFFLWCVYPLSSVPL
jgi:hypothetical protein